MAEIGEGLDSNMEVVEEEVVVETVIPHGSFAFQEVIESGVSMETGGAGEIQLQLVEHPEGRIQVVTGADGDIIQIVEQTGNLPGEPAVSMAGDMAPQQLEISGGGATMQVTTGAMENILEAMMLHSVAVAEEEQPTEEPKAEEPSEVADDNGKIGLGTGIAMILHAADEDAGSQELGPPVPTDPGSTASSPAASPQPANACPLTAGISAAPMADEGATTDGPVKNGERPGSPTRALVSDGCDDPKEAAMTLPAADMDSERQPSGDRGRKAREKVDDSADVVVKKKPVPQVRAVIPRKVKAKALKEKEEQKADLVKKKAARKAAVVAKLKTTPQSKGGRKKVLAIKIPKTPAKTSAKEVTGTTAKTSQKLVCQFCWREFVKERQYQAHKKTHAREDEPYVCRYCDSCFEKDSQRDKHMRKKHDYLKCVQCGAAFDDKLFFERHMLMHTGQPTMFACKICGSTFTRRDYLVLHVKIHKSEMPADWDPTSILPKEKTASPKVNGAPRKKETTGKTDKTRCCIYCGKSFKTTKLLQRHIVKHSRVKRKFECQFCPKRFETRSMRDDHLNTHTGNCPHKCDECEKAFRDKSSLRRHKICHRISDTGEKPYQCDQCEKSYSDVSTLKKHRLLHAEGKKFECDVCHKMFPTNYVMRNHRLTHGGQDHKEEKLVRCESCGRGFLNASSLQRHLGRSGCKEKYECAFCEQRFFRLSDRTAHMKEHMDLAEVAVVAEGSQGDGEGGSEGKDEEGEEVQKKTKKKAYNCSICNKTLANFNSLTCHYSAHIDKRQFKCDTCGKAFATKGSLKKHALFHVGSNPVCPECNKAFFDKKSLRRHMLIHTGEKPYKCEVCGKAFHDQSARKAHLQLHSGVRSHKCPLCDRAFVLKGACTQHIKTVHKVRVAGNKLNAWRCCLCDEEFTSVQELVVHKNDHPEPGIRTHKGEGEDTAEKGSTNSAESKPFSCTICGMSFAKKAFVSRHMRVHTGEKPYKCDMCDKCYTDPSSLRRHKSSHSNAKPHLCDICGKSFRDASYLNLHKRMHSDSRPFACDLCDKRFIRRNFLNRHVKMKHTARVAPAKKRSYPCKICGKVLLSRSSIQTHQRMHTGEKPFLCQTCGKAFPSKQRLINHTRVHTGEKPFTCKVCDKAFAERGSLRRHAIIHTGLRPYACKFCDKAFSDKSALNSHTKMHTEEKQHECLDCGKKFWTRTNLKAHERTHWNKTVFQCGVCRQEIVGQRKLTEHLTQHEKDQRDASQALAATMIAVQHIMVKDGSGQALLKTGNQSSDPEKERFACHTCSKTYSNKKSLARHAKTHTAQKLHECDVCKKSFTRRSYLKDHATLHTGEKPFACDVCGKAFRDRTMRKRHMYTHEKRQKIYECNVCQQQFLDKGAADLHLKTHTADTTTELVYECYKCGKAFEQSESLVDHMIRCH